MAKIGVIGGSGLYDLEGIKNLEDRYLSTPFGEPSSHYLLGTYQGVEVAFLPRHGKGHRFSPSEINYRANIFGMKKLGVDAIISISACGSLKEELKPMDFVVPDQLLDRTRGQRESSFFTGGIVAHVAFADPFSSELRAVLLSAAQECRLTAHDGGTYVTMEGPQFSTKAESNLYRSWGMSVIGMTNGTEAKLAREAEIAYVTLAAVTDYDCWHEGHDTVTVEMIIANLQKNIVNAKRILEKAIPKAAGIKHFEAHSALKNAIITAPDAIPEEKKKALEVLIGKYLK